MKKKVVIVGGVAGGASAACRLRRLDEEAEIIILEKSPYVSYANCGLPYYVGDVIKGEEALLLQTPESLKKRFNIEVRVNNEVIKVEAEKSRVIVKQGQKEYAESYDYLILAPGSKARKMYAIEDELYHLKTVDDALKLKKQLADINSVAIIGAGFIGVELAENLVSAKKEVTVYEYADHILANLDDDMAIYVEKEMRKHLKLITHARIKDIIKKDGAYLVCEEKGESLYDAVVVAAGVSPNTDFLKDSGITMDRGYIVTNEHMQTNIDHIYACGDACENKDFITQNRNVTALAGPANRQGRIIADNIAGLDTVYDGSIGTCIIKAFNITAASCGLNKKRLDAANWAYKTLYIHPFNHATYYPGATMMHGLLYYDEKDYRILGFMAVGEDGVDKFCDVISTVIKLKGTVKDLSRLELAYAPSFLSAKSPANYLGFMAENAILGLEEFVTVEEALKTRDHLLLDVRSPEEYALGHFVSSMNIPLDELRSRLAELQDYHHQLIDVYCAVGIRAHIACCILKAHGFKVRNITGAYIAYQNMLD